MRCVSNRAVVRTRVKETENKRGGARAQAAVTVTVTSIARHGSKGVHQQQQHGRRRRRRDHRESGRDRASKKEYRRNRNRIKELLDKSQETGVRDVWRVPRSGQGGVVCAQQG